MPRQLIRGGEGKLHVFKMSVIDGKEYYNHAAAAEGSKWLSSLKPASAYELATFVNVIFAKT
jgi:hypothetical protein